ncbi:hypothetical protein [Lactobacillus apis]|uniref:hypothetical protein n=1 Tax=Lactobacillus apis TaxID=303541 RepID=UPI0016505215|nr:hypothetical protein [Lactobacillus apis]MBC6360585.1 hypothetical protein [Lactobacillus apis]
MSLMMNGEGVNHLIVSGKQFDANLIGKSISLEAGHPIYRFAYQNEKEVFVQWGIANKAQSCTITEVLESISLFGETNSEHIKVAKLDSVEVYVASPEYVQTYKNTMFIKLQ